MAGEERLNLHPSQVGQIAQRMTPARFEKERHKGFPKVCAYGDCQNLVWSTAEFWINLEVMHQDRVGSGPHAFCGPAHANLFLDDLRARVVEPYFKERL